MDNKLQNLKGIQLEVYDLFYNQGLSISDIAKRRGVTYQAIKKTIGKLIKKGYIEQRFKRGLKSVMPIIMGGGLKYFRIHNLHLILTPYYFYERYKNVEKGFGIPFKEWTITFNKKNIELQLKRKASFDNELLNKALEKAQEGITDIIFQLQDKYGFEVFKEGKANIKLVNQHIAEVENGIAKRYQDRKISIIGKENKVWLMTDLSTGTIEIEAVKADTSTDDMRMLQDYLNDWRDNKPPTNTELLKELVLVAKNQAIYNKNIESHLGLIDNIGIGINELRDAISELRQGIVVDKSNRARNSPLFHTNSISQPPKPKNKSVREFLNECGWFD